MGRGCCRQLYPPQAEQAVTRALNLDRRWSSRHRRRRRSVKCAVIVELERIVLAFDVHQATVDTLRIGQ